MNDWRDALSIFSDTVAFVMGRAPDQFPVEDFLPPDKQMTLDRAYVELRAELQEFARAYGESPETAECEAAINDSYEHFRKGETMAGKQRLNKLYHLLLKLGS